MKLTIFNGSPRGKNGNTEVFVDQFIQGFTSVPGRTAEKFHIKASEMEACQKAFADSELVVFAFPMYVHSLPSNVKTLIELVEPFPNGKEVPMGFIVQFGFSETIQAHWLTPYLERLPGKLGAKYLGTILKGGAEGTRLFPPIMNRRLFKLLRRAGKHLAQTGEFDQAVIKKFARPVKISALRKAMWGFLGIFGLTNYYWNMNLKKNNAYEKRFDAPYAPQ